MFHSAYIHILYRYLFSDKNRKLFVLPDVGDPGGIPAWESVLPQAASQLYGLHKSVSADGKC